MSLKRAESVLILVHTQAGRLLLLEREDWPGFWQSVTGSLEPGESPLEAAWRELAEETGLNESNGILQDREESHFFEIYPRYRKRYPEGTRYNREHVFWFCLPEERQVILTEHKQYIWSDPEQAVHKLHSETNRGAVVRFLGERD